MPIGSIDACISMSSSATVTVFSKFGARATGDTSTYSNLDAGAWLVYNTPRQRGRSRPWRTKSAAFPARYSNSPRPTFNNALFIKPHTSHNACPPPASRDLIAAITQPSASPNVPVIPALASDKDLLDIPIPSHADHGIVRGRCCGVEGQQGPAGQGPSPLVPMGIWDSMGRVSSPNTVTAQTRGDLNGTDTSL